MGGFANARNTLAATLLTLMLLACAGCSGSATPEQATANQAIADRLTKELQRDVPKAREIEVVYADDATNDANVFITVDCDNCDTKTKAGDALRAVWRSEITPIRRITVFKPARNGELRGTDYNLPQDEPALVERFGERPMAN